MRHALALKGFLFVLLVAVATHVIYLSSAYFYHPGPLNQKLALEIISGSSNQAIARQLSNAGVVRHAWLFALHTRLRGKGHLLKAGEYEFTPHLRPFDVYMALLEGKTVVHRLTLIEGTTSAEVLALIQKNPLLSQPLVVTAQEGELLPETYYFSLHGDRNHLIQRMKEGMKRTIAELWEKRQPGLPFQSPEQALILASIVEKETYLPQERPRVAGVFINRLRKGMPLQADPTVSYGLLKQTGHMPSRLSRRDLKMPSEYNTYLIKGLPPTPICNPSRASLKAVLNPQPTKELFFAATGIGGHAFSKTLKEHQVHHNNLRRLRSEKKKSLSVFKPSFSLPQPQTSLVPPEAAQPLDIRPTPLHAPSLLNPSFN